MVAILTRVRWNLRMVLIGISFMTRDGEHFFHPSFDLTFCLFCFVLNSPQCGLNSKTRTRTS
jgi:hypothetical protein